MSKTNKFDWHASESAPRKYPMEIIAGSLRYHDGSGSLYIPDKSTIHHGWGTGISSHVTGPDLKPLPNKLTIAFFSYTENQFYRGSFDLPYDKILKAFQDGYYSPNENKHSTYRKIVVGVAPGGAVAVWLVGIGKTTEVFFAQAEKYAGEWSSILDNPKYTREEHVRLVIEESLETPEALAALKKNGVPLGLWSRYHSTRYPWQPLFTSMTIRDGRMNVKYFNGELDILDYPLEKTIAASTRAVPSYISFIWEYTPIQGRSYELTFHEPEIFDAFKKLGNNNPPLQLEMRMAANDEGKKVFSVWLRNAKESIPLKQTVVKIYGVSDRKVEGTK